MNERSHGREEYLKNLSVGELMEKIALETDTTPASLTQGLLSKRQRVQARVVNTEGKYRVLAVDTYDHDDWVDAEFDSAKEALEYIRAKTAEAEAAPNLIGSKWDNKRREMVRYSESTSRFYAYTPEGNYIDPTPKESQDNHQ